MNKRKSVGVILITYNGESYIYSQLESLRNQSLSPDMVLIFDDCSTDKTASIISDYINEFSLENWKLTINPINYSWEKNCFCALTQCNTDIIFWSDQDDVWYPNKIKDLYLIMLSKSYVAVYSCWDYIDSNSNDMNIKSGIGTEKIYTVNPFSNDNSIPPLLGCSACFTRELIGDMADIIPCEFNSPDWLLYRLGVTLGKIGYYDKRLFQRRIHQHNVSTSPETLYRNWKFSYNKHNNMISVLIMQLKTLSKLIRYVNTIHPDSNISFIEKEYKCLRYRINFLLNQKSFCKYAFLSFQSNSYMDFINTFFKDICYCLYKIFK